MGKEGLKSLIKKLQNEEVSQKVKQRMKEFQEKNKEGDKSWFDELCFCILTANSTAKKGIEIQNYLSRIDGFRKISQENLTQVLKRMGHRFYNRRSEFIVKARKHKRIKEIVTRFDEEKDAREWLVKNIKGIGYKEGSHFLRNVGYHNIAILDRHILRVLDEHRFIDKIPKTLTPKKYLKIENIFLNFSKEIKVLPSEMDLYLWYSKTGEVLK